MIQKMVMVAPGLLRVDISQCTLHIDLAAKHLIQGIKIIYLCSTEIGFGKHYFEVCFDT